MAVPVMAGYGVVIPAFNAAATIGAALNSVLAQTVKAEAIVVVDDGSTDDTVAVIEAMNLPVTVLRQENEGPGSATTRGFDALSTPFVATLDADDLWLPDKIEKQLACLDRDPGTAGVFAHWRTFRGDRPDLPETASVAGWSRTTMMIRQEVVTAVGPIVDPQGGRGEMIDWIARVREAGFVLAMLDDVLALRRIRPGSLSYGRDPARDRGYLEVARLAMKRRAQGRAGGG
ncbi:glycosyltransferase family 2 protein [Mesorhizobium sp. B283B1A]|uniref:glycosyltransferase family 2 protein n=1 Tax=Mesorhizobium TaxID=68287 RepID=UPI001CD18024|nr:MULTISPECIES: glycosyltransferase family A protein [Mesorhizobium]MCA0049580.1 glycosyltransferase family 2 protein [Mesorhizobium sp. B283B1A]UQS65146.1 glycosyltransferase family 2 protein [Mesorhizobium opportunistum]